MQGSRGSWAFPDLWAVSGNSQKQKCCPCLILISAMKISFHKTAINDLSSWLKLNLKFFSTRRTEALIQHWRTGYPGSILFGRSFPKSLQPVTSSNNMKSTTWLCITEWTTEGSKLERRGNFRVLCQQREAEAVWLLLMTLQWTNPFYSILVSICLSVCLPV